MPSRPYFDVDATSLPEDLHSLNSLLAVQIGSRLLIITCGIYDTKVRSDIKFCVFSAGAHPPRHVSFNAALEQFRADHPRCQQGSC